MLRLFFCFLFVVFVDAYGLDDYDEVKSFCPTGTVSVYQGQDRVFTCRLRNSDSLVEGYMQKVNDQGTTEFQVEGKQGEVFYEDSEIRRVKFDGKDYRFDFPASDVLEIISNNNRILALFGVKRLYNDGYPVTSGRELRECHEALERATYGINLRATNINISDRDFQKSVEDILESIRPKERSSPSLGD